MFQKLIYGLGLIAALMIARNIYVIAGLPEEVSQGMIFKIIFFHAPMAITAMLGSAVAAAASITFLVTKRFFWDSLAVAVTEVGLAFLAANLITGSIWARVIWGVWWVWDLRLTSALVCWLLYAGYLMLRHAIEEPTQRATFAAVFNIFAFIDVPIVYLVDPPVPHPTPRRRLLQQHRQFPARLVRHLRLEPARPDDACNRHDLCPPAPGRNAPRNRLAAPHRARVLRIIC